MAEKGSKRSARALPGTNPQAGPVLVVDDEPYDGLASEGVLAELKPKFPVRILTSGEELVDYLEGRDLYRDRSLYPLPSMVLLDLDMPSMNGFQVLDWLKNHDQYASIPVVVLSRAGKMVEQVTRAYGKGASAFLPKPVQLGDVKCVVSLLNVPV